MTPATLEVVAEADALAAVAVVSPSPDVVAPVSEAEALPVEVTRVVPLAVEPPEAPDAEAVLVPEAGLGVPAGLVAAAGCEVTTSRLGLG